MATSAEDSGGEDEAKIRFSLFPFLEGRVILARDDICNRTSHMRRAIANRLRKTLR